MALIRATHELHDRRKGRNIGVGLSLFGFIAVVFGLTVVKMETGAGLEGFDHAVRPSLEMEAMRRAEP